MEPLPTEQLVRRAQEGSAGALDALYRRSAGKLLALIRLRLGPSLRAHVESRDILQAALLKSYTGLAHFQNAHAGSFMAWLARIAENEIRDRADHLHRAARDVEKTVPLDGLEEAAERTRSIASEVILNDETERLEKALSTLAEEHREVIVLRKLEELSYREISARLGRSEDACRMLLSRAMTALTLAMAPAGSPGSRGPRTGP